MIDVPTLIELLGEKGHSPKEIAEIVRACTTAVPAYGMEATTLTARQLRNHRHYEAKKRLKASEKASEQDAKTSEPSESVLLASETSEIQTPPRAPVHTRGENNLSRLVDIPNLTTLNASDAGEPDLDWPSEAKPSKAYLDRLEAALRATAGPALDPTATKLFSLASILALGRNGAGPPCDMQADVLPTIRARSARAPPQSVRSWDFYTDAIREARDRRLIGAPETRPIARGQGHERPQQSAKLTAKLQNMVSAQRGAEIALARRPG